MHQYVYDKAVDDPINHDVNNNQNYSVNERISNILKHLTASDQVELYPNREITQTTREKNINKLVKEPTDEQQEKKSGA